MRHQPQYEWVRGKLVETPCWCEDCQNRTLAWVVLTLVGGGGALALLLRWIVQP